MAPEFAYVARRELTDSTLIFFSKYGHCPVPEYPAQFSEAMTSLIFENTPVR